MEHLTADELTAYRDGALENARAAAHIRECSLCRKTLLNARLRALLIRGGLAEINSFRADDRGISTHPDAAALAAYHDDALSEDERIEVEDHLLECQDCLQDLAWLRESLSVHPVEKAPRDVADRVKRLLAGKAEPAEKTPARPLGKLFVERLSGLQAQLVFRPSFAMAAELSVPAWAAPAVPSAASPLPASPSPPSPAASRPGASPLRRSAPPPAAASPPPAAAPPPLFSPSRDLAREAPRSYSRARRSAPREHGSASTELEAGPLRLILAVQRTPHEDRLNVTALRTDTQQPEEHLSIVLNSSAGGDVALETDAAGMVSFPLADEISLLTIEGEAPVTLEIRVV